MLYPDVLLPIPEEAVLAGPKKLYVYLRLVKAQGPGKRKTICKQISIGKVAKDDAKHFHPNENYYAHYGITPPDDAAPIRVGRRSRSDAVPKAGETQARARRRKCQGSFMALRALADDLGMTDCLFEAFGEERGKEILSLVPYFALENNSSCDMLDMYTQFAVRGAGHTLRIKEVYRVFASIRPAERDAFLAAWRKRIGTRRPVVHFAPTLPHRGDKCFDAFLDLDTVDDFTTRVAVVLSREARLPVNYFPLEGPLLNGTNIPHALKLLKDMELGERCPLVIPLDLNEEDMRTLSGLDMPPFIFTATPSNFPKVREAILAWWDAGEHRLVRDETGAVHEMGEIPFQCGPLKGRLLLFVKRSEREDLERKVSEFMDYLRMRIDLSASHELPKAVLDLCDLKTTSLGKSVYVPNEERVRDFARVAAALAAFTTDAAPAEQPLAAYFQGKLLLPAFVGVNRDSTAKKIHLHMGSELHGKIFVLFLALILRMALIHKLEAMSFMTLARCHRLLDAIHLTETDGRWEITSTTNVEQRELLSILDLQNGYPRPGPGEVVRDAPVDEEEEPAEFVEEDEDDGD